MLATFRDWLLVAFLRILIFMGRILPWHLRTRWGGRFMGFIARIPNTARKRVIQNTTLIYPDWSDDQRKAFVKDNLRHFGQNLIELYNIERFCEDVAYFHPKGEGWEALHAQKAKGEGAICVSGHFGQWEAIRALMASDGMQMAGLFKENSNPYYEEMFAKALKHSGPMFHTGVRGMSGLVRVLKDGGFISLLHDQRIAGAPPIPYLGREALTSTAAAELALKYGVPLIPMYGVRHDDGRNYDIIAEAPIAPSDPLTMTRAMNDSLSRMVESHPAQWYWLHNRWHIPKAKTAAKTPKPQQ